VTAERSRWREQWARYVPDPAVEEELLRGWIAPLRLEDVRGARVLDVGCGNGTHAAAYARSGAAEVLGVDFASVAEAAERWAAVPGLRFAFHDLDAAPPPSRWDLVFCVGVLPHVPRPRIAVRHLAQAVAPGGRLVIWATVREQNLPLRLFDLGKHAFGPATFEGRSRLAWGLTAASRPLQKWAARSSVARSVLPYGEWLGRCGGLPRRRVQQNFFDALNAPRRLFFTEAEVTRWLTEEGLVVSAHVGPDGRSRTWVATREVSA
jgi:SAM-dependent methyltransferase